MQLPPGIMAQLAHQHRLQMRQLLAQGAPPALLHEGVTLFWGRGRGREPEKGLQMVTEQVEKGFIPAFQELGHIYLHSDIPKYVDMPKAREIYKQGADKGNAECQNGYGMMCWRGIGGPLDLPEAFKFLTMAHAAGNGSAKNNLALIYLQGGIPEVPRDPELGLKMLSEVADRGDSTTMLNLATIYAYGEYGTTIDYEKAVMWAVKSSSLGSRGGTDILARLTLAGKGGLKKDPTRAFRLTQSGAEANLSYSQNNLGVMLAKGIGTEKNLTAAFDWFKKASDNINPCPLASYNLATMYRSGLGVEADLDQALTYYKKAEAQHLTLDTSVLEEMEKNSSFLTEEDGIQNLSFIYLPFTGDGPNFWEEDDPTEPTAIQ
jgi:TPR repeat protein